MEDEIDIAAAAAEPLKASGDQGAAENHTLPDLIAAEKFRSGRTVLAGTDADGRAKSGRSILRVGQFKSGGAV